MSVLWVIAVLLAVLVLVVCQPVEKRAAYLRWLLGVGGVLLVAYYVGPVLIAMAAWAYDSVSDPTSRAEVSKYVVHASYYVCGGMALLAIGYLGWAGFTDFSENRAIRAGSKEAFDKRVNEYVTSHNYTRKSNRGHDKD